MKLNKKKIIEFLPKIPSIIFSSILITLVLTFLLVSRIQQLGLIVSSAFFYIILPIITYIYLTKFGLITDKKFDFNIVKREERTVYNIILSLGFFTNFILISMYNIPIIKELSLLLAVSFLIFTIITLFWKISGHMTQSVLFIIILAYLFVDFRTLILSIGYLLCIPLVGYSRVKLKHHDIWQVIGGTVVTTVVAILILTIF